jgi:WD40 repeat protein
MNSGEGTEVGLFGMIAPPLPVLKQDLKVVRSFNLFNIQNAEGLDNKKFPIDIEWLPGQKSESVVVCDSLGNLLLVNAKTKAVKSKLALDKSWLYSVDCDVDSGSLMAVGSLSAKIHIVSHMPDEEIILQQTSTLLGHRGAVKTCKFLSRDYLISGSSDSLIGVWNINQSHKYMSMLQGHMNDINALAVCSIDRNIFLSGGADVSVKLWDIRLKGPEVCSYLGGESSITDVQFLPGVMETFAVSSDDSKVRYETS